jgi:hypothetical protein
MVVMVAVSSLSTQAQNSGGVVLLAMVIIVLPLVFVLPRIWLLWPSRHPCCSPFPPREQLLMVAVGDAAVVVARFIVHMVLQPPSRPPPMRQFVMHNETFLHTCK